jgi:hypothetical protein
MRRKDEMSEQKRSQNVPESDANEGQQTEITEVVLSKKKDPPFYWRAFLSG